MSTLERVLAAWQDRGVFGVGEAQGDQCRRLWGLAKLAGSPHAVELPAGQSQEVGVGNGSHA